MYTVTLFSFLNVLFPKQWACSFLGGWGGVCFQILRHCFYKVLDLPVSLYSALVSWKGESSIRYFP